VKGPQINDAALSHKDSMDMRAQISSSPAIVNNPKIFLPKVGTNCVDSLLYLSEY
jgi:hypothetical protein